MLLSYLTSDPSDNPLPHKLWNCRCSGIHFRSGIPSRYPTSGYPHLPPALQTHRIWYFPLPRFSAYRHLHFPNRNLPDLRLRLPHCHPTPAAESMPVSSTLHCSGCCSWHKNYNPWSPALWLQRFWSRCRPRQMPALRSRLPQRPYWTALPRNFPDRKNRTDPHLPDQFHNKNPPL